LLILLLAKTQQGQTAIYFWHETWRIIFEQTKLAVAQSIIKKKQCDY